MTYTLHRALRNWGAEFILYISPSFFALKILHVKAGTKGGLQYHHFKDEAGFIIDGKLRILKGATIDDLAESILTSGSFFSFPPGIIHQEEALTDTFILEVSSPHLNDRVRYDRDPDNTLPSTCRSDVVTLSDSTLIPMQLVELGFSKVDLCELPEKIRTIASFYL
jgi:quercetin dioxygenase-like cupin family protein